MANDGRKAIDSFIKNEDIDLVLLDIQLPEISGYQVAREMKLIRKHIPIIAQTAFAMMDDREKCLEAGCDEYITKPISKAAFMALVAKHINHNEKS